MIEEVEKATRRMLELMQDVDILVEFYKSGVDLGFLPTDFSFCCRKLLESIEDFKRLSQVQEG